MPKSTQDLTELANVLGLYVSGDVGDMTCYTTRKGRVVMFPKAPPTKPPTQLQINQRSRFKAAQANYMATTQAIKDAWEKTVQKMSLDATGQNCWISLSYHPDQTWIDIANRISGESLTLPPPV